MIFWKGFSSLSAQYNGTFFYVQFYDGAGYQMGDILDDFVRQRYGFESYERVERGLAVQKKQGAMSMFNDTTKGRFIFLIDSRACVPSIKLSSVDVIIIYCSDWNPTNDLRVLQKINIDSKSECVPIFRLYSSCTLEEKALILAKHDRTFDGSVQNITPILSHSLLSWGASFLFSRLERLENDAYSWIKYFQSSQRSYPLKMIPAPR